MHYRSAPAGRNSTGLDRMLAALAAFAGAMMLAGCSVVPVPEGSRAASYALKNPGETSLAQLLERHRPPEAEGSGFTLLTTGRDMFDVLRELAATSERTLDVQYYIWRDNETGHLILASLIEAADRGVRVRVLLDDWGQEWSDEDLATLDSHRNVEVRLYNPTVSRTTPILDAIFDLPRITHRMHNKVFAADNTVAVIGGRNIGDRYFTVAEKANYRDLDLLVTGDAVQPISASFDEFWNSPWSAGIARVRPDLFPRDQQEMTRLLSESSSSVARFENLHESAADRLVARFERLIWADDVEVVADPANKPQTESSQVLLALIERLAREVQHDLLIEVAYLIPGEDGLKVLCGLVERGIRVRILTNSLESSDVITSYVGYSHFRAELLKCGIELYEFRPDGELAGHDRRGPGEGLPINLHTKAAVFDGRHVYVGSFNADPRSVNLNTEIAALVDSPPLAADVTQFVESGMAADNAYRLALQGEDLVWITSSEGQIITFEREPGLTFWRQVISKLLSMLPIQDQL